MKSFLKFLGLDSSNHPEDRGDQLQSVRSILNQLNDMDPQQARYYALFACELSRVARADLKISEEETHQMVEILVRLGQMHQTQADLIVSIAKKQSQLLAGTENYLISRVFLETTSRQQQEHLLECLFAVAASDESISFEENQEIRQIAEELKIEHHDFIAIRQKFREKLAVLKDEEEEAN